MSRGTLTMVFDDGYQHIFERVLPLLDERAMPGVFAISLEHEAIEKSEGYPVLPWERWLPIATRGHEIAAHGITHRDLTALTPTERTHELLKPHQELGATTLVYPGGAYNNEVQHAAQRYYRAARTVKYGFANPAEPFELPTINYTKRNFSVWRANARALWAWVTNQWLIETYHLVTDDDTDALHAVPLSGLVAHLNFVRQLPIRVATIRDVIAV